METISTQIEDPRHNSVPRAIDKIAGVVEEDRNSMLLHREKTTPTTPSSRTTNDKGAASHAQPRWMKSSGDGGGLRRVDPPM